MPGENQISVIVPVYNVEGYLARCVDSILGQTYENLEVILVDDGSRDGSGALCDAFAQQDHRVKVIHKPNGGLSSARNTGIDAAQGEYLAFVDSDDWLEPDAYAQMLERMKAYDVKLVCGGRYDVDGGTGEKTLGLCPEKEECIPAEEQVGRIFQWNGCDSSACDKLYHHSLLEGIRYPEGKVCEDVPTTYKIVLRAEKVVLWNQPVYNYFHRPNSISTTMAITEKTFHFSQHTAEIYPDIRTHYPMLEPQAAYLRVWSLAHILLLMDQADPADRQAFRKETREARKSLRKHTGFVLKCPHYGKKQRVTYLLLILGLYRWLRPVFHR